MESSPAQPGPDNLSEAAQPINTGDRLDSGEAPMAEQRIPLDPALSRILDERISPLAHGADATNQGAYRPGAYEQFSPGSFGVERPTNDTEAIDRNLHTLLEGLDPRDVTRMEAAVRGVLIGALDNIGVPLEERLASYQRSAEDPAKSPEEKLGFLGQLYTAEADYMNRKNAEEKARGPRVRSIPEQFGVGPDVWSFMASKMKPDSQHPSSPRPGGPARGPLPPTPPAGGGGPTGSGGK